MVAFVWDDGQRTEELTGVCWDNALDESFFATYKLEMIEPAT
jgi:hypothetical protein